MSPGVGGTWNGFWLCATSVFKTWSMGPVGVWHVRNFGFDSCLVKVRFYDLPLCCAADINPLDFAISYRFGFDGKTQREYNFLRGNGPRNYSKCLWVDQGFRNLQFCQILDVQIVNLTLLFFFRINKKWNSL